MSQKYSVILSTFIKLPFVINIFVLSIFEWPFYTGFTVPIKKFKQSMRICIWSFYNPLKLNLQSAANDIFKSSGNIKGLIVSCETSSSRQLTRDFKHYFSLKIKKDTTKYVIFWLTRQLSISD